MKIYLTKREVELLRSIWSKMRDRRLMRVKAHPETFDSRRDLHYNGRRRGFGNALKNFMNHCEAARSAAAFGGKRHYHNNGIMICEAEDTGI